MDGSSTGNPQGGLSYALHALALVCSWLAFVVLVGGTILVVLEYGFDTSYAAAEGQGLAVMVAWPGTMLSVCLLGSLALLALRQRHSLILWWCACAVVGAGVFFAIVSLDNVLPRNVLVLSMSAGDSSCAVTRASRHAKPCTLASSGESLRWSQPLPSSESWR